METRYLDEDTGRELRRATRFNGVGWYVIDDRDDVVAGPFTSREAAEKVVAEQFTPPGR
ncbi:SPOR domain-containing protein [Roseomonas elaeocarpi]|uniref:SPOR domain-containing protein n=1 Tax=Roseomonas elaeocarpi TaxID=907779 RepID=A0ABV6JP52_9PROT